MVEAYFDNIRKVLIGELKTAKESIFIAVAWFTDRELFSVLQQKSKEGIRIYLCITDDSINKKGGLAFESLTSNGGGFYKVKNALMHNKFCVIDEKNSITGSYNWTYSASRDNHENIVLTTDDIALAARFIEEFNRITKRVDITYNVETHLARFINRLELIQRLVSLEEKDDIEKHAKRLGKESRDERLKAISINLLSEKYEDALEQITDFIKSYSNIAIWTDPEIEELKLALSYLKNSLLAIDNEVTDAERIIKLYHKLAVEIIGKEVEEALRLKSELAFKKKGESKFAETKHNEAKAKYEQYRKEKLLGEKKAKEIFLITEQEKVKLKALYREAVILGHPDKVAEIHKKDAEATFIELKDAYEKQDIKRVEAIGEKIKQGIFKIETEGTEGIEILKLRVAELRKKMELSLDALAYLRKTTAYRTSKTENNLQAFFQRQKEALLKDIETLKTELNGLGE